MSVFDIVESVLSLARDAVDHVADVSGTVVFPREIQLDDYSCGARSVYAISRHFKMRVSYREVKRVVGTTEEGTEEAPIVAFFRSHGLRVGVRPRLRLEELRRVLEARAVVLISLDGDHYGVVHAMSDALVWVADPSVLRQQLPFLTKARFKKRWGREGVIVYPPRPRRDGPAGVTPRL